MLENDSILIGLIMSRDFKEPIGVLKLASQNLTILLRQWFLIVY